MIKDSGIHSFCVAQQREMGVNIYTFFTMVLHVLKHIILRIDSYLLLIIRCLAEIRKDSFSMDMLNLKRKSGDT